MRINRTLGLALTAAVLAVAMTGCSNSASSTASSAAASSEAASGESLLPLLPLPAKLPRARPLPPALSAPRIWT